ncbi:ABC transporter substrate-binding protein [Bordetella tumulicola]
MVRRMHIKRILAATSLAAGAMFSLNAHAETPTCELDRPIKFGGMNWESNLLIVDIERYIVEHGYGCKTDVEPGDTLPMFAALQRGDVDINAEVWSTQMQKAWDEAIAEGKIKQIGEVFSGTDGWYIPRYTAEKYPDLRKVADLKGRHELFLDDEEPTKGRLYGCAVGWTCGNLSANLIKAFKLQDEYLVYSPGSSASQRAAITSAYKRKKDIVFYYWTPTSLAGSLDLVKLELPPVDEKALECFKDAQCADPQPTGIAPYTVKTAVNVKFADSAPQLIAFLAKINFPEKTVTEVLGHMENEGMEVEEAALYFLKTHPDLWTKWVPADVAERVRNKLAAS